MSLQIWLPFNGDLHNQGLANINLTNTVTFSTPGKIGQSCLNSQLGWFAIPEMAGKKQMSFAYWVKLNNGTTTNWLDPFSWYSTDGSSNYRSRQEFYYYNTGGNTQAMTTGVWYYNTSNSGLSQRKIGQWYHYAFTINYETGITQFFVDGQLWKTTTDANTTHYIRGTGSSFLLRESSLDCSINDFRLYDHVLSAKEVEEIAKGLVLHYKLDNIIQPNLLSGNPNLINAWVQDGITLTQENDNSLKCVVAANNKRIYNNVSNVWTTVGNTYTVSFLAKAQANGIEVRASRSIADYAPTFTLTTDWKYYSAQITITATSTGGTLSIQGINNGDIFWLRDIKLENGDIATHYLLPNNMINIIYDSSGYNNNGTIIGSVQTITPNPRYNCAAHLESSSPTTNNNTGLSYIQTPLQISAPTQITVCWWAHPENGYNNSVGHGAWCTSANNEAPLDYNSTAFHHRDNKFDICLNSASTTSLGLAFNNYTKNEWHYYCVVYDGKNAILYKDGVETNRSSISSTIAPLKSFTNLYIGFSKAGGVWRKTLGAYSDFRIYSTALTAEKIKELYNTSATIDNSGNIHTRELVE